MSASVADSSEAYISPSSSASSVSGDASSSSAGHSTRALASASERSQCLEGIVERLVRPLLAERTLSEELQALVCSLRATRSFRKDTCYDRALTSLSPFAQLYLTTLMTRSEKASLPNPGRRPLMLDVLVWSYQYDARLEMIWEKTTSEQRYAATTQAPHESALRAEVQQYSRWLEEHMYLTVGEVFQRSDYYWLQFRIEWSCTQREARDAPNDNLLDWFAHRQLHLSVYEHYRAAPNTAPISLMVWADMTLSMDMHLQVFEATLAERVQLTDDEKKRIAEGTVTKEETANREEARKKRRKVW